MKALVYEGNQSLAVRDVEEPTVGDSDALIQVHSVGICGSICMRIMVMMSVDHRLGQHEVSGHRIDHGNQRRCGTPCHLWSLFCLSAREENLCQIVRSFRCLLGQVRFLSCSQFPKKT